MRAEGWEQQLAEYLSAPPAFAWGEADCALWAADWVRRCTGTDCAAAWRGKYRTEPGAARLMKRRGFRGPADIAAAHLTETPVALAKRGDLVLHPDGALGICAGRTATFLTAAGATALDTLACPRAWAV